MRNECVLHIDKIHTTKLGEERIKRNLKVINGLDYCLDIIKNNSYQLVRKGKNWYVETDQEIITINAYSYTIITAHKKG